MNESELQVARAADEYYADKTIIFDTHLGAYVLVIINNDKNLRRCNMKYFYYHCIKRIDVLTNIGLW